MDTLKYSLIVFLGACSYGILSTVVKFAYRDGFTVGEVVNAQYFFGWCMLLATVFLFARQHVKVPLRQLLALALVGTNAALTGVFYGISLKTIPASIAVILLFQFTWIGIVIEAVAKRALPDRAKLVSVSILYAGTLLAGGILENRTGGLPVNGIIYGLLSAVTFALFIFVSGRVAAEVPALTRSLLMTTGSMVLLLLLYNPSFLYNGSIQRGLWKYGLILGFFGIVIPIICFNIGTPRIGSGLATILGAAELPTAVLASVFILQEKVTVWQWAGVILILLGIVVPQQSFKPPEAEIVQTISRKDVTK